jgi:hypothetical protein
MDPREEFAHCDPFPVCAAHTRVGIAIPLDELNDALDAS